MSSSETAIGVESARQAQIVSTLRALFGQLFGLSTAEIDVQVSFLEMGADSLSLLRVSQTLQEKFGVKVPFRMLLEELSTITDLAAYLAQELPPEAATPDVTTAAQATAAPSDGPTTSDEPAEIMSAPRVPEALSINAPAALPAFAASAGEELPDSDSLERTFARQLEILSQQMKLQTEIMSQQLTLLRAAGVNEATAQPARPAISTPVPAQAERPATPPARTANQNGGPASPAQAAQPTAASKQFEPESFVPYHPIKQERARGLPPRQQAHLDELIARVTARTGESKRLTQTYRAVLADSRTSAGFRQTWKEMCYPLVIERGQGSKVFDADGHEYIDLTMGFGALLFGHSPGFLIEALQEAVTQGVRLGGQSHLVGEAANLICELTGVERVAFCNSGTEAVMAALRIARTVTGRTKVALFEGSYHGTFDGVMVKPGEKAADGSFQAMPLAPGVPQHMIEDVLLLGYDDEESLAVIRAHAHELAAVLIEPPRSRRPDVQPKAFLHELRKITSEAGVALVFDEVVTGFRFHPGGVQALFGVQADLVAYGKALGGGVPVAVVAGKAAYMDAVDGGQWHYGDASYPRAETTFFAGTYFKNPLIVAAVTAVLKHLKASGPQLYEELNARTARLAHALNEFFEQARVPMRVTHLGSLFRFLYPGELKLMELFYYHLLAKGIYICETRNCFLSTAHTDEDVDKIIAAVKETVAEMRAVDIIPTTPDDDGGSGGYKLKDPFGNLAGALTAAAAAQPAAHDLQAAGPSTTTSARTLPLTEGQKQLWFLAQIGDEASVAYNLSMTLRLRGPLQLAALRASLQAVVNNHEALRITFSADGSAQYIHPTLALDVPVLDFPAGDDPARVQAWLDAEARRPFDLVTGPLLRARVLKLADEHHLLVLTMHHIVTDGWSLGVLVRELSVRYTAACTNRESNLPQPAQFSEYVLWEAAQHAGIGLGTAEDYWLGQFAAPVAPLDLPADHARPVVQTYTGARERLTLDAALMAQLEQLGAQHNSTPFMLLLASFNLLLHKLSQQADIVVGIPAAGQAVLGNSLIGYCVNVLPLRSRLAAQATFKDYLASVKRVVLDAYEHQTYPFNRLVKKLKLPRDPGRAPLVTVMFNLDRAAGQPQFHDLETELLQNATGSAQFDLDINITQADDGLHIECDFNTSLFEPPTIRRWLNHFRTLLVGVVGAGNGKVARLSLLEETERQRLLVAWNATRADFPASVGFSQLFEAQAARTPSAIAVAYEDVELSYAALNDRANRLAHALAQQGVGPERVVAVLAERSPEFLLAVLAIFKAGGAYLPLDPQHPPYRIAQVLAQSNVTFVLTTEQFSPLLTQVQTDMPAAHSTSVQTITTLLRQSAGADNPRPQFSPHALAYVIYTSGSTGVPKGAMVEQAGMLNHLYAKIADLGLTQGDVVAQTASQCFDISVWQFLAPLLVGGRVQIFADEVAHDSTRLLAQVERTGVTILETVPALLRAVVENVAVHGLGQLSLAALRWLLVTGEALPPDVVNRWLAHYASVPLLNAYGPTECSDDVAHQPIHEPLPPTIINVPVGRPVANTQLYILDDALQPLPLGVAGELCVGGIGVGRGYLGRPELTADKFIPDQFAVAPGARLYRTGDLARYLPTGAVEFLGRRDQQVKVRGHRIELGEIEAALRLYAQVRDAAVVVREDAPGDRRLVAYVVTDAEPAGDTTQLRTHLRERLPEYMVPAAIVTLAAMPLTPNGKLDRTALPAPDGVDLGVTREYVSPRTPVEEKLARIWAEVLRVERVGVHDNFFELGGDSILSISVVADAQRAGLQLNPAQLFQHQTIAELATVAAEVGAETADEPRAAAETAIEDYRAQLSADALPRLGLDETDVEDIYPLSFTQQGMLFHHLYAPDSAAYFEQVSWTLHGTLDAAALQRAWAQVVARQPILRTLFAWEDLAEPLQIVLRQTHVPFDTLDWQDVPAAEQTARLEAYLQADRRAGFDLATPPTRLALIRLGADTYQFIWSYHHILLDGWAIMLVLKDVFGHYEALREGREFAAPPVRPYRDYIHWLEQQDLGAAEQFWRRTLAGFTTPTPLEIERARADEVSGAEEFAVQEVLLPESLTSALQAWARRQQLTMSTIVQGAWALVLSRYSARADVLFGTVVSGRPAEVEGIERMIGLFINTLPTRARITPDESVVNWLRNLQGEQAQARQYEYSPLAQVQGWSEVKRGVPLFESIVAFENYPVNVSLQEQRASIASRNVHALERVTYPLFVVVGPGAELALSINYDGRRFDAATVDRMLGHLRNLFESFVAQPEQRLSELTVLTGAERRQLLVEWNDTAAAYPHATCVHQLFEAQATRTPGAVALSCKGFQLSYGELNARADQLASLLGKLGVGPETLVGICVERSVELVVAVLGVWKAGGAYVPLDPAYPRERLAYMLADARPHVLLTQESLRAALPAETTAHVVYLDTDWEMSASATGHAQGNAAVSVENLAYVIYTSGSTGAPKGVQITHRALGNFLHAMHALIDIKAADTLLAVTSLSFDIAGLELFLPLVTGARVEVATRADLRDGARLREKLLQAHATFMQATPITWEVLLDAGWRNDGQLTVLCGGEAFPPNLTARLLAGEGAVWNLYGPTETTIWSTACQLTAGAGPVSIGRPIANTQVYVLDEFDQPTPVGVTGALYIGGDGLSRGYLARPDLTAERFIPDPFGPVPGARLYQTGDLARYLPGGDIQFLGRNDQQVKIHGHRIEPGEIEAALMQHASIRQAVVVAREDVPGDRRLVAYVVTGAAGAADTSALRGFLRERLPEFMIPVAFVPLAALPLTPNGKIDRKALPAPEGSRPELHVAYVAPRTPVEESLAAVWAEVLGIAEPGVHDNFFELGGDSIRSIQVIGRAKQVGLQLTPAQLFEQPTIAELAQLVNAQRAATQQPAAVEGELPLTPMQQWFFAQNPPEPQHFNQALLLEVPATLDPVLVEAAVAALISQHDALRLRFKQERGYWRQRVVSVGGATPFSLHDLSGLPEDEQPSAIEQAADVLQRSLNLSTGPLLRVALFRLGMERPARLLIVIHHLAVDISSWRILLEDFQIAYDQLSTGAAVVLPAQTTSFAQWTRALSQLVSAAELHGEAEYWLSNAPPPAACLPVDFAGENSEGSAAVLSTQLTEEDTQALLHDVPRTYRALPSEVLLTALTQALARWSGAQSWLIDLEGHGRESFAPDIDLARTVGWCTALYPVRLALAATPTEALKLVKEQVRAAPRGGLSYGVLKYMDGQSALAQRLRALPRAEVSFNYVGAQESGHDTHELRPATEHVGHLTSTRTRRPYLLMVSAQVQNDRLTIHWAYSRNVHRAQTISRLAAWFEESLQPLLRQAPAATSLYTPSDFPHANLSQLDLDEFLATFGSEAGAKYNE